MKVLYIHSSCGLFILMPCFIYSEVLLANETFLGMKFLKKSNLYLFSAHAGKTGEHQTEWKQLPAVLTLPCLIQTNLLLETNSANWIIDITLINQHPNKPIGRNQEGCSKITFLFSKAQSFAERCPAPCYFHFCYLLSYLSCCHWTADIACLPCTHNYSRNLIELCPVKSS